jgi:sensor histidine kinase YesM
MRAAPDRALATLYQLTALLRAVLRGSNRELTTLGEELEIVEAYLAIERSRFEDRLEIEIAVPTALRAVPIVPLLLQPLVENAVKHGIGSMAAGGKVSVTGMVEDTPSGARLCLQVRDTGQGASAAELARGRGVGVGLANIARRLQLYYGSEARLEMHSVPGAGTVAGLILPAEAPLAVLAGAAGDGR